MWPGGGGSGPATLLVGADLGGAVRRSRLALVLRAEGAGAGSIGRGQAADGETDAGHPAIGDRQLSHFLLTEAGAGGYSHVERVAVRAGNSVGAAMGGASRDSRHEEVGCGLLRTGYGRARASNRRFAKDYREVGGVHG